MWFWTMSASAVVIGGHCDVDEPEDVADSTVLSVMAGVLLGSDADATIMLGECVVYGFGCTSVVTDSSLLA